MSGGWLNGWLWIIFGLALALAELILPGWVLMGAGLAVLTMGLALLAGIWTGGLPWALVATAILSGLYWFALSRVAGAGRSDKRIWDRDINDG